MEFLFLSVSEFYFLKTSVAGIVKATALIKLSADLNCHWIFSKRC